MLANIRDNGLIDLEIDGQKLALDTRRGRSPHQTEAGLDVGQRPRRGRGLVDGADAGAGRRRARLATSSASFRIRRKEIGCEYTDRIEIGLVTDSAELAAAIAKFRDYIAQETLASEDRRSSRLPASSRSRATVLGEHEVDRLRSQLSEMTEASTSKSHEPS